MCHVKIADFGTKFCNENLGRNFATRLVSNFNLDLYKYLYIKYDIYRIQL